MSQATIHFHPETGTDFWEFGDVIVPVAMRFSVIVRGNVVISEPLVQFVSQ